MKFDTVRDDSEDYGRYRYEAVEAPDGYEIIPEGAWLPRHVMYLYASWTKVNWVPNTSWWNIFKRARRTGQCIGTIAYARKVKS